MNPSLPRLPGWLASAAVLLALTLSIDLVETQGPDLGPRASIQIDGREAVAGEVLVRVRSSDVGALDVLASAGTDAEHIETVGRQGLRRLRSRALTTEQLLATLRANPDIELVEPNYILRVNAIPNDPGFLNLWGLLNTGQMVSGSAGLVGADIGAIEAWDITTGSRANVVAILDTGVDHTHPDLRDNMWRAPSAFTVTIGGMAITCAAGTSGFNTLTNTCDPADDNGHGTHVAGTIGATGNNGMGVTGINWIASMMAVKFLDASGTGTTAGAIKGLDFISQAKAAFAGSGGANVRVVNNSYGGGAFSQLLLDEINRTNSGEMLFVAAAGNAANNNDTTPSYPASYNAPNVLAVAASDHRDQLAAFSNFGATSVHLAAPGVGILSSAPHGSATCSTCHMATKSGTSMAAPHVSGAAALMLSACAASTAALKARLMSTVEPIAALTGTTVTGGRLNLRAAIAACNPPVMMINGQASALSAATGDTLNLTVSSGPGNRGDWVTLVPAGAPAAHWSGVVQYLNGTRTRPAVGLTSASLAFPAPSTPGTYEFRLLENDSWRRLATSAAITVNHAAPIATALAPASVLAGSDAVVLTVTGSGFSPASEVRVNGVGRATTFVSPTALSVTIAGSERAAAGTLAITVVNPSPGGGTSAALTFTIAASATLTVNGGAGPITVAGGSTLTVGVSNGPGNRGDFLMMVPTGAAATFWSGIYRYLTGTTTRPASGLNAATVGFTAPTAGGTFEVRLFENDSWTRLATSPVVTVTAANPVPGIVAVAPASVTAGAADFTLTVSGTGFVAASVIHVNGSARATTFVSATTLTAAIPASDVTTAGTRAISVVSPAPGGGTSGTSTLTVAVPAPTPALAVNGSAAPITINGGTTIAVAISNGPANRSDYVMMVPTGAAATFWSGIYQYLGGGRTRPSAGLATATLSFDAPPGGGTFEFRLFENDTLTRLATSPVVTVTAANPVPAVSALAPASVAAGGADFTLSLTGTGFVAGATVRINGSARATTFVSATSVTAALLAADIATAGTRTITVVNPTPGGGTSNGATLTVTAPVPTPALTVNGGPGAVSVNGGTSLTVGVTNGPGNRSDFVMLVPTGSAANHWSGIYQYLGGGTTRPAVGQATASLTFVAPPAGGTFEFRFFENDSWTRLATSPVVTVTAANPAPAISTIAPASVVAGGAGFTLTVTGTGFVTGSVVHVNGSPRTTTLASPTSLTASITAGDAATLGSRAVTVVSPAPGGGTSNAASLTIQPPAGTPLLSVNGQASGVVTVAAGSTVTVNVWNGPGFRSDWVTMVPAGAPPTAWSGIYKYLSGTTTRPGSGLTTAALTFVAPASGSFEFRLFENDSWTLRASASITVGAGGSGAATLPATLPCDAVAGCILYAAFPSGCQTTVDNENVELYVMDRAWPSPVIAPVRR